MMALLNRFWVERSGREQWMLGVMGALLVMAIFWLGVIRPLADALEAVQARLDQASAEAGPVASRAALLANARKAVPPPLGSPVSVAVGQAAGEAGFTLSRLDPQGDDRVVIAISAVKSPVLFGWFGALARKGVFAERVTLRPNSDASLSAEATLRVRQP